MDTSLDITRALKVSIRGLPKDWRRPPGRTRYTSLRTLEADLVQPLNLGFNSAWKYAQDRFENTGSTSWKPLRSSLGHARNDDDDDDDSGLYTVSPKKHVTTFSTITLTISVRLQ